MDGKSNNFVSSTIASLQSKFEPNKSNSKFSSRYQPANNKTSHVQVRSNKSDIFNKLSKFENDLQTNRNSFNRSKKSSESTDQINSPKQLSSSNLSNKTFFSSVGSIDEDNSFKFNINKSKTNEDFNEHKHSNVPQSNSSSSTLTSKSLSTSTTLSESPTSTSSITITKKLQSSILPIVSSSTLNTSAKSTTTTKTAVADARLCSNEISSSNISDSFLLSNSKPSPIDDDVINIPITSTMSVLSSGISSPLITTSVPTSSSSSSSLTSTPLSATTLPFTSSTTSKQITVEDNDVINWEKIERVQQEKKEIRKEIESNSDDKSIGINNDKENFENVILDESVTPTNKSNASSTIGDDYGKSRTDKFDSSITFNNNMNNHLKKLEKEIEIEAANTESLIQSHYEIEEETIKEEEIEEEDIKEEEEEVKEEENKVESVIDKAESGKIEDKNLQLSSVTFGQDSNDLLGVKCESIEIKSATSIDEFSSFGLNEHNLISTESKKAIDNQSPINNLTSSTTKNNETMEEEKIVDKNKTESDYQDQTVTMSTLDNMMDFQNSDDEEDVEQRRKNIEKFVDEQRKLTKEELVQKALYLQNEYENVYLQKQALQDELEEMKLEMEELQDQFRVEDADQLRILQSELDSAHRSCRVLQFKVTRSERRNDALDDDKFKLEEKIRDLLRQSERLEELEDELQIAKEVSVRLHAELLHNEQWRVATERLNCHLREQLDTLKDAIDGKLNINENDQKGEVTERELHDDIHVWRLSNELYDCLLREYMLQEELAVLTRQQSVNRNIANSSSSADLPNNNQTNVQLPNNDSLAVRELGRMLSNAQEKSSGLREDVRRLENELSTKKHEIDQLKISLSRRSRSSSRSRRTNNNNNNNQNENGEEKKSRANESKTMVDDGEMTLMRNRMSRLADDLQQAQEDNNLLESRLKETKKQKIDRASSPVMMTMEPSKEISELKEQISDMLEIMEEQEHAKRIADRELQNLKEIIEKQKISEEMEKKQVSMEYMELVVNNTQKQKEVELKLLQQNIDELESINKKKEEQLLELNDKYVSLRIELEKKEKDNQLQVIQTKLGEEEKKVSKLEGDLEKAKKSIVEVVRKFEIEFEKRRMDLITKKENELVELQRSTQLKLSEMTKKHEKEKNELQMKERKQDETFKNDLTTNNQKFDLLERKLKDLQKQLNEKNEELKKQHVRLISRGVIPNKILESSASSFALSSTTPSIMANNHKTTSTDSQLNMTTVSSGNTSSRWSTTNDHQNHYENDVHLKEIKEFERLLEIKETEIDRQQRELRDLADEKLELQKKVRRLKVKIDSGETTSKLNRTEIDNFETRLNMLNAENNMLKKEKKQLQNESDDLKIQLEQTQQRRRLKSVYRSTKNSATQCSTMNEVEDRLNSEVKNMKEELECAINQTKKLMKEKELERQENRKEIQMLKERLLLKDKEKMKKECERIETLKRELDYNEIARKELKSAADKLRQKLQMIDQEMHRHQLETSFEKEEWSVERANFLSLVNSLREENSKYSGCTSSQQAKYEWTKERHELLRTLDLSHNLNLNLKTQLNNSERKQTSLLHSMTVKNLDDNPKEGATDNSKYEVESSRHLMKALKDENETLLNKVRQMEKICIDVDAVRDQLFLLRDSYHSEKNEWSFNKQYLEEHIGELVEIKNNLTKQFAQLKMTQSEPSQKKKTLSVSTSPIILPHEQSKFKFNLKENENIKKNENSKKKFLHIKQLSPIVSKKQIETEPENNASSRISDTVKLLTKRFEKSKVKSVSSGEEKVKVSTLVKVQDRSNTILAKMEKQNSVSRTESPSNTTIPLSMRGKVKKSFFKKTTQDEKSSTAISNIRNSKYKSSTLLPGKVKEPTTINEFYSSSEDKLLSENRQPTNTPSKNGDELNKFATSLLQADDQNTNEKKSKNFEETLDEAMKKLESLKEHLSLSTSEIFLGNVPFEEKKKVKLLTLNKSHFSPMKITKRQERQPSPAVFSQTQLANKILGMNIMNRRSKSREKSVGKRLNTPVVILPSHFPDITATNDTGASIENLLNSTEILDKSSPNRTPILIPQTLSTPKQNGFVSDKNGKSSTRSISTPKSQKSNLGNLLKRPNKIPLNFSNNSSTPESSPGRKTDRRIWRSISPWNGLRSRSSSRDREGKTSESKLNLLKQISLKKQKIEEKDENENEYEMSDNNSMVKNDELMETSVEILRELHPSNRIDLGTDSNKSINDSNSNKPISRQVTFSDDIRISENSQTIHEYQQASNAAVGYASMRSNYSTDHTLSPNSPQLYMNNSTTNSIMDADEHFMNNGQIENNNEIIPESSSNHPYWSVDHVTQDTIPDLVQSTVPTRSQRLYNKISKKSMNKNSSNNNNSHNNNNNNNTNGNSLNRFQSSKNKSSNKENNQSTVESPNPNKNINTNYRCSSVDSRSSSCSSNTRLMSSTARPLMMGNNGMEENY
ncbi:hypothetical protein SNEBB_009599 [Seison nebaliae]|nr:hypothetical protein SNEBB_009599 [Seison nebaliae]